MNVVRHRERLALGGRTSGSKLAGLNTVVQAQRAHVEEGRQNTVKAIMAQIVQLALADHRQAYHRDLHLVRLQGDIVSVEITAVIDVLCDGIHDRVVARCVQLFFDHLTAIH